ncbi:MAG: family 65 glycosyl hydrolase domain-containing protein [Flavobacteriales bacterium]
MMDRYLTVHPWKIIEKGWNPGDVRRSESIFSIGNGRFGQRANFEEQYSGDTLQGSYVGGVYYPDKTRVGWWKNGYPEYFAKVLNATNWIATDISVDGETVDLHTATAILDFERCLDMQKGLLSRRCEIHLGNGVKVLLESERFCSMANQDVAALQMHISVEGASELKVKVKADGDVVNEDSNWDDAFWVSLDQESNADNQTATVVNRTNKTEFTVATSICSRLEVPEGVESMVTRGAGSDDHSAWLEYVVHAPEKLILTRTVSIASSLHHDADVCFPVSRQAALDAMDLGYDDLKNQHIQSWADIWKTADIQIQGDAAAQQGIRFNIFHLNQTYQGDDSRLNIGPKGFTGEKYGGASYWDTEAYCLPFYLASRPPAVAEQLLKYRYDHLPRAIENAEKLGFGCGAALYPMVTMNGEECHNEWEITFEEIHRNGAIAYAIMNHERFTGNEDYTHQYGFPVLLGIARFWAQRVNWSEDKEQFVMLGVTGPNEYENNVNNNWYTNYIAAWCLRYAADVAKRLRDCEPNWLKKHEQAWTFNLEAECRDWLYKADNMYLPQLASGIRLQQDGFMDKEQLNASDLPDDVRPINQHWSWDRILRSIFIKQADVLQGFYFFEDDFTIEEHELNFDFYEPKTVHESSLSPCIHVVLAAKLGKFDKAYEMYLRTSRLDLDDYNKEAYQGLHITSMAGTWLSVVEGFGGFRVKHGMPHFDGKLPEAWSSFEFGIVFRNRRLHIVVNRTETKVTLVEGEQMDVMVSGERRHLTLSP